VAVTPAEFEPVIVDTTVQETAIAYPIDSRLLEVARAMKHDHGMRRCWLKEQTGDALHALLCVTGCNMRWLLRAIVRLGLGPIFFVLAWLQSIVNVLPHPLRARRERFRRPNLSCSDKMPDRPRASSN
jgi:hypothetical protein